MDKILKEFKVEDGHDRDVISKIRNMPYYAQLVSGVWEKDMPSMPICKLIRMINTAAYIGIDSRKMVDQLLYRIGRNRDVFPQYFVKQKEMYEPAVGKFGNAVTAEIRGILGPAPYLPGFVYAPGANMADAVRASNIRLASELESEGAKFDTTICKVAIQFSSVEMCKWLLSRVPSFSKHLTEIINRGRLDLLPLIDSDDDDGIYLGCSYDEVKGHAECLKYAIEHGYIIGYFALDFAIQRGHPRCFSFLLNNRINFRAEVVERNLSNCKNTDIWQEWIKRFGVRPKLENLTIAAENTVGLAEIIKAGHVFDFRTHIRNYMPMSETMQMFWSSNFHKWQIVRIIHEGKAETLPGEIRCGSFRGDIASLRYQPENPQQNQFICELLQHRSVEYNAIKFRVEFDAILVPHNKSNIEQILWETIELLLQEKIDATAAAESTA